jgi:hypothetical protein
VCFVPSMLRAVVKLLEFRVTYSISSRVPAEPPTGPRVVRHASSPPASRVSGSRRGSVTQRRLLSERARCGAAPETVQSRSGHVSDGTSFVAIAPGGTLHEPYASRT